MKTITILIFFSSILLINCNQSSDLIPLSDSSKLTPLNSIKKDSFIAWNDRWNDDYINYMNTHRIDYANVPILDFNNILSENADSARIFLGLEKISRDSYECHFLIGAMIGGTLDSNSVLDYSRTCPPWCKK